MPRLRKLKTKVRVVAIVAAGLVAANGVVGVSVALALSSGGAEQGAASAALSSPHMAVAAGAMVFALSGFASALAMRLAAPTAPIND
jgi:hypothetical protein